MKEELILDDDFLRELFNAHSSLDPENVQPAGVLEDSGDQLMIKTFTNTHKASFYHKVLTETGIPNRLVKEELMGNVDVFFNKGTFLLFVEPGKAESALEVFDLIEQYLAKNPNSIGTNPDSGNTSKSPVLLTLIIIFAIVGFLVYGFILLTS